MGLLGPKGLLAAGCLAASAFLRAADENHWPVQTIERSADATVESRSHLGPLFFEETNANSRTRGLRPFYLQRRWPAEQRSSFSLLYPFFTWERRASDLHWSVFSLINFGQSQPPAATAPPTRHRHFEVFPFYFSRDSGEPATSYRALLPLHGTLRHRFGSDRIDFTLAPLYVRTQTAGVTAVNAPWPFIKTVQGGGQSGFQIWPFYGRREKAGVSSSEFVAWPFYLANTRAVEGGTDRFRALLPFYSARTAPGLRDRSYLLFFGTTERTAPAYSQVRYFWPLLVQTVGANGLRTDRWAPFYSHSLRAGNEKTWVLWPVYRQDKWQADGLAQRKTQLLYWVYWNLNQRDPARPGAPTASKTHLWPLYSAWDNGAGARQFQLLSPFEVFFQHNETVRTLWSPLAALYRSDRRSPQSIHRSLLFNAVVYQRTGSDWRFTCGPLFSTRRVAGRRGFSILGGLVAREATPARSPWRFFWSPVRPTAGASAPLPASR